VRLILDFYQFDKLLVAKQKNGHRATPHHQQAETAAHLYQLRRVAEFDHAGGLVKGNVLHGIVPTISSPQLQMMHGSRSSNQRIAQLHMMAPAVLPHVLPGPLSYPEIDRNAFNRHEKRVEGFVLFWARTVPQFRYGYRRANQRRLAALAQNLPASQYVFVPRSRHFNQYVGIDENGLHDWILRNLFPFRSRRM
jgi:hypothetical protein